MVDIFSMPPIRSLGASQRVRKSTQDPPVLYQALNLHPCFPTNAFKVPSPGGQDGGHG